MTEQRPHLDTVETATTTPGPRRDGREGRRGRWWLLVPVVVVELLLVVAVIGGATAWHDGQTLRSSHALAATAQVTRTEKSCRASCVWDSYGSYTVGGQRESDVLLQCCARAPLPGPRWKTQQSRKNGTMRVAGRAKRNPSVVISRGGFRFAPPAPRGAAQRCMPSAPAGTS